MLTLILASLLYLCVRLSSGAVGDSEEYFEFVTRPDILAPRWDIKIIDQDSLQQGYYWFTSPYENVTQQTFPHWIGPHIYDGKGELIWSGAPFVGYINSHDFRVSTVNGKPMLSFIWCSHEGKNGYILDDSYEVFQVVDMVESRDAWNIHEFKLIDDGQHALIAQRADFAASELHSAAFNGSCRIAHSGFEEVNRLTGEKLFEWRTGDHIKLEETTFISSQVFNDTVEEKCSKPWDIAHLNSVDKFDDGDYLISARHTNTLYKISHKDGSILWRLGGIWSDFEFLNERSRFSRQHCALIVKQNSTHVLVSLFDNATGGGNFEGYTSSASSGMILALRTDTQPMTAELVSRYPKPQYDDVHKFTKSRGSMHLLPNGNAFMGWATRSQISEHSPGGQLLMTALFKTSHGGSYRIYKMPWVGKPVKPPDVAAVTTPASPLSRNLTTVVHVSWNGATEVDTWTLYHTNHFGNITQQVAVSPRQGFETKFTIAGYLPHVQVVARDRTSREIGQSDVIPVELSADLHTPAMAAAEHRWEVEQASHSDVEFSGTTHVTGDILWFAVGFICCLIVGGSMLTGWLKRRRNTRLALWRDKAFEYQPVNGVEVEE